MLIATWRKIPKKRIPPNGKFSQICNCLASQIYTSYPSIHTQLNKFWGNSCSDLQDYYKCHSTTSVFHSLCSFKSATWFFYSWKIGLKWVTNSEQQTQSIRTSIHPLILPKGFLSVFNHFVGLTLIRFIGFYRVYFTLHVS